MTTRVPSTRSGEASHFGHSTVVGTHAVEAPSTVFAATGQINALSFKGSSRPLLVTVRSASTGSVSSSMKLGTVLAAAGAVLRRHGVVGNVGDIRAGRHVARVMASMSALSIRARARRAPFEMPGAKVALIPAVPTGHDKRHRRKLSSVVEQRRRIGFHIDSVSRGNCRSLRLIVKVELAADCQRQGYQLGVDGPPTVHDGRGIERRKQGSAARDGVLGDDRGRRYPSGARASGQAFIGQFTATPDDCVLAIDDVLPFESATVGVDRPRVIRGVEA